MNYDVTSVSWYILQLKEHLWFQVTAWVWLGWNIPFLNLLPECLIHTIPCHSDTFNLIIFFFSRLATSRDKKVRKSVLCKQKKCKWQHLEKIWFYSHEYDVKIKIWPTLWWCFLHLSITAHLIFVFICYR